MTLPSSVYLPHPENQPFDVQVNETIRILLEQAAAEGIGPAEIRFTANVTPFPDEHVAILGEQMNAAGLTVMLVDDGWLRGQAQSGRPSWSPSSWRALTRRRPPGPRAMRGGPRANDEIASPGTITPGRGGR